MTVYHPLFYPTSFIIHLHTCNSVHMYVSNNLRTTEHVCMKTEIPDFVKNCSAIFVIGTLSFKNSNKAKSYHPMSPGTEENIPLQFFFQAK